ncbi:MAG TPA: 3'-5' exonuclease, partial [Trueperaceae bacterium]|nr:3'-5' exonuclease [Trueperaceae bacterium]
TGLSARDEILEIAAVGPDGAVLFESLVQPKRGYVPAASTRIHGLSYGDVVNAPTWPEVVEELFQVVSGYRLLAWNASFDERLCAQSSRAWGLAHPLPGFECAMRAYANCRGVGSGALRLERAASVEGVLAAGQSHRSADDARLTVSVLRCLQRSSAAA